MSGKDKNKKYDLMQDTQYLLTGLDDALTESFALEDILAEFGGEDAVAGFTDTAAVTCPDPLAEEVTESAPEKRTADNGCEAISAQETSVEAPQTAGRGEEQHPCEEPCTTEELHPNVITFPLAAVAAGQSESGAEDTLVIIDMKEYEEEDDVTAEELFNLPPRREAAEETAADDAAKPEGSTPPEETEPRPLTMEDIVASTVDAVKEERERKQLEQRKRIEKQRRKEEKKRPAPRAAAPLPEVEEESSPKEAAVFHKRRLAAARRSFRLSVPVILLMWLPWIFTEMGIVIPYFSAGAENAAVCIFAAHVLLCILCAPLFRAALEELKERSCTFFTYTALTNLVVLLDEVTLLALPGRGATAPLGSVAGCALVFGLWGLKNYHLGMCETFRTAAMGQPSAVADCGPSGIAKGPGRLEGFMTRANMESTASQWQRMMLPLLVAASLVFALLASVGQDKGHSFWWCWSVILTASCALTCPLSYCVPFGRVARRLGRSGAAVAGQYGAAALASSSKLVVTDLDLFPRSAVALSGIKLYGEERSRAISYASTLAVQGGGCMALVFEHACAAEHISLQPLEHFHIHDDNGLSGMIRGETVLVGTPMFMRHRAVRLPATLPAKTSVCLAVDGELVAVFAVKYSVNPPVEIAMRSLARNGLQLVLATRDGNVVSKMLRTRFGTDGKAQLPEISERLALSDPNRETGAPSGIIYRDGMLPYVEMTALSHRLCHMSRVGTFLSMLGSVFGALLAFYLVFVGRVAVLTPLMLMTFMLLWVVPMIPLLVGVDKL